MYYGTSYYPEHKNEAELNHDIKLLIDSKINTIRMGEFSWCRMEPKENEYDFNWLIKVVNKLGENGINTVLCTPTACPPIWLIEKYPNVLYQDNKRVVRPFGGRRHYCYTNENYRKHSEKITRELSKAFGKNPYVIAVQIDNEPAQEGTGRCTCKNCESRFHKWLEEKYKTIEEYNKRSGSIFWSQEYTRFDQISFPVNTIEVGAQNSINAFYESPTVRLDFENFASDMQIEYQDIQTKVLKEYFSSNVEITTNGTGLATNSIDYYKSFKDLDKYAFDYYPDLRDAQVSSLPYAFGRGIKEDNAFWILEFMSGGGHRLSGSGRLQPNPNALKQSVLHSFAHGAQMMLHFQFRTYPFGAEQLNYAIVDMDGVPRRRYFEMKETAELLEKLKAIEYAEFKSEVAIVFDYESHWALRIKPVNDPVFKYLNYLESLYKNLEVAGLNADVISLKGDLNKYKVLILPTTIILSRKNQEKLKIYVKNGGVLIGTFLTSVKNEDNVGYTDVLPAGLTEVFATTVEEVEPVFEKNINKVEINLNGEIITSMDRSWSELLGGDSKAVGTYLEDYKVGEKAISVNNYGKGKAYYIGTDLEDNGYINLFKHIAKEANISCTSINREKNVEVVKRFLNNKEIIFIFNFTGKDQEIKLDEEYTNYISQEKAVGKISIERNGTLILEKI
ncbi:MAG: beta-galactosidase [Lachnospirales bacterium]